MINESNIKIYAEAIETEALEQFYKAMALPCNVQGALMPDTHAGYTLPIGAVVKSKNKIFPAYVGYDIGCGMSAIKTSIKDFSSTELESLKHEILKVIPLGRDTHKSRIKLQRKYVGISETAKDVFNHLADMQIGTLGGGNHFIEIGTDNDGYLNIVIHSGSRGVGKKIAEFYMKQAAIEDTDKSRYEEEFEKNNNWKDKNPEGWEKAKAEFISRRTKARVGDYEGHYGFELDSEWGKSYLNDMNEALQFALDNRELMINNIVKCMSKIFGNVETSRFINRNHNHAEIVDEEYVIHRKGATHAEFGMLGVIPGNMRDGSFIVKGKGNVDSLASSSHGAGRVLSRRAAKDLLNVTDFHNAMIGIVTNHSDDTIDEAPDAYKNIFEVMDLQKDLVEVIDRIKPVLNIKG